jgi:ribonuclease R
MIFDRHGNKKRHEFLRATMRSAATITYQEAQRAFDGEPDAAHREINKAALAPLWNAYQSLVIARDKRDPLNLDLPERRVIIGDDGKVKSIAFRDRLESMRVIEELMIQANVAAAESLEKARMPLLYRIHEHPSKEKLFAFSDYLRTIGMSFAKGQVVKPGVFNRILAQAKEGTHAEVMNDVVLRTQAQAIYSPDNIGHFGLNLERYAHFTSPIRRYADLIVHRALIRGLKLGTDGLPEDTDTRALAEVAASISATERRAMKAERETADRLIAHFLADRVGATFDGHISGVTRAGLFVELDDTGADGFIPARFIGDEYFRFDEAARAFIGHSDTHRLGDPVMVELVEAAPVAGALRFKLLRHAGAAKQKTGHQPPGGSKFRHRQSRNHRRRR